MTVPYLMNCPHIEGGWCLGCVAQLGTQLEAARLQDAIARLMTLVDDHCTAVQAINNELLTDAQYESADIAIGDTRKAIETALRELLGEIARLRMTLTDIRDADPRNWDLPHKDALTFMEWAKSRARCALSPQPVPDDCPVIGLTGD